MNGKSQMIKTLSDLPETENLNIKFRTSCKGCKFEGNCCFYANARMIKKRCYIDTIAEKLNIKQQTVIVRCNSLLGKIGCDNFSFIPKSKEYGWIGKKEWQSMNNNQRIQKIDYIIYYLFSRLWSDDYMDVDLPTLPEIKIVVAILNCYFSAWRDEKYIHCAKCGKMIKNSKQRNRKYCNSCKDRHNTFYEEKIKICIDCGCKFEAWHNREVRCIDCQIKANKVSARERAKRYRERKHNGLGQKS